MESNLNLSTALVTQRVFSQVWHQNPVREVLTYGYNQLPNTDIHTYLVAGVGFEPTTSRLWALRATSALPRCMKFVPSLVLPQHTFDKKTLGIRRPVRRHESRTYSYKPAFYKALGLANVKLNVWCRYRFAVCAFVVLVDMRDSNPLSRLQLH